MRKVPIRSLIAIARRRHGCKRNVVAVAVGGKFKAGRLFKRELHVQFYVSRKPKWVPRAQRLPKSVTITTSKGRKMRIPTDVIDVGKARLACGAGSDLWHPPRYGATTLLWRFGGDPPAYRVMTCSHCLNGLSKALSREPFQLECSQRVWPGHSMANTFVSDSKLPFDVATGDLTAEDGEIAALKIDHTGETVSRIGNASDLVVGLSGQASSRNQRASIPFAFASLTPVSLPIEDHGGNIITYDNLYVGDSDADEGDSGGLIYLPGLTPESAVGLGYIVAVSVAPNSSVTYFQLLADAIKYLRVQGIFEDPYLEALL